MKPSIFSIVSLLGILFIPAAAYADKYFEAELRGSNQVPAITTDTRGQASFVAIEEEDSDGNITITELDYVWSAQNAVDLLGAAGGHIHCGQSNENGPITAFLAGIIEGGLQGEVRVEGTLTDQNVIAVGCGSTIEVLVEQMEKGNTYVNIHSKTNTGGEIRGQIELDP